MRDILIVGILVLAILSGVLFGLPVWNVWKSGLSGEAKLKRAEQTKLIIIEQARAEKESAQLRADAISIMGKAAKEYPEYRLQEFMGAFAEALQEGNIEQIIYVPTEGNIPILEANRKHK
jgi:regulator of protease activity HflC (stomatin/prohibitin superfamily)|tara:strand:- start:2929 stop:3288 length:360 start_codon:yes stop_codon:yes gene_type:complete